jgi:hypothetical protein
MINLWCVNVSYLTNWIGCAPVPQDPHHYDQPETLNNVTHCSMKNPLNHARWTFGAYAILTVLTAFLVGCRTYTDSWQPAPIPTGNAWHNEHFQQTAFDTNSDGRIDRLRFWSGSGSARELQDRNQDGWFDDTVFLAYERESKRIHMRARAPLVPATGSTGAFPFPPFPL